MSAKRRHVCTEQLAAGYVVYGSSTIPVYTTGDGVHGFTLDPTVGAYVLSHEDIRMPESGSRRILEIEPTSIHQRTPLVVGSRAEMQQFKATA